MTTGIYKLVFTGTKEVYIGQALNINDRFTRHIRTLRNNEHSKKLQRAYLTYGIPKLEILQECAKEDLNTLENFYIEEYNAAGEGFNSAKYAGGGCSLSGEAHPLSQFPNSSIVEIIEYIVENPTLTLKEVGTILDISSNIISHIFQGSRHTWVELEYPYLYKKLQEVRLYKSFGEAKGPSKTSNDTAICIFKVLVEVPEIPFKEISEHFNVPLNTINAISKGTSYKWLKDVYPSEYAILESLKGTRSRHKESGILYTVKSRGIVYPDIISPKGIVHSVDNISAFAREHALDKSTLHRLLNSKVAQHKGWKQCPKEQVY